MSTHHVLPVPREYAGVSLMDLNEKQKLFAEIYSQSLTMTNAALEAGYSKRHAIRLLQQPDVNAYLQFLADNRRYGTVMSKQELLERLTAIGRGDVDEEVVTPDGRKLLKGTSVKDQTKALELLGKGYGIYKEVQEVQQQMVIDIGFADEEEIIEVEGTLIG